MSRTCQVTGRRRTNRRFDVNVQRKRAVVADILRRGGRV
ncbi:large ribosomal subunit protein bL28 [Nocardioides pyridinolyticus]